MWNSVDSLAKGWQPNPDIIANMEVTIQIPGAVANKARERGLSVAVYIQELIEKEANKESESRQSVREAVDRILELRKGNKLNGLKIKDLIEEGRKY